jgi:hypothetical protein
MLHQPPEKSAVSWKVCLHVCMYGMWDASMYASVTAVETVVLGQSEFHLGDYVNVLVRGSLLNQPLESEGGKHMCTTIHIHISKYTRNHKRRNRSHNFLLQLQRQQRSRCRSDRKYNFSVTRLTFFIA